MEIEESTRNNERMKRAGIPDGTFTDQATYIKTVRNGIPGTVVKWAIEVFGGNRDVFVRLLETSSANLSRYYGKKSLSRSDTEEVLDALRVYREAVRVFHDEDKAREWLDTPISGLAGERPIELFDTFEGRKLVGAALRKIEYGEFS